MKIAIYTTMPLTNEYTGPHGITMFMFPLIKRLKESGHQITYFGRIADNLKKNIFCDVLGLKPYILDIKDDVIIDRDSENLKSYDALLVYNRPATVPDEYYEQCTFIAKAIKHNIPVLFWMGDMWGLPDELMRECYLLRPFKSELKDSSFKGSYHFEYFTHKLINYELEHKDRPIDHVYIGNFYNRFDNFKQVFESLEGNIVVAGSWLRDKERWDKSLSLKNILYIGEIPHSMAIPLLAMSKKTHYIIPNYYIEAEMKTSRLYEAKMAETEICCGFTEDISADNTDVDATDRFESILFNIGR